MTGNQNKGHPIWWFRGRTLALPKSKNSKPVGARNSQAEVPARAWGEPRTLHAQGVQRDAAVVVPVEPARRMPAAKALPHWCDCLQLSWIVGFHVCLPLKFCDKSNISRPVRAGSTQFPDIRFWQAHGSQQRPSPVLILESQGWTYVQSSSRGQGLAQPCPTASPRGSGTMKPSFSARPTRRPRKRKRCSASWREVEVADGCPGFRLSSGCMGPVFLFTEKWHEINMFKRGEHTQHIWLCVQLSRAKYSCVKSGPINLLSRTLSRCFRDPMFCFRGLWFL